MGQFYKILTASPLGEPWESHGKQNQTFWCQVEGEELAVSISKQVGNVLLPGMNVYGDLMKAVSQKGTNYWKFKSSQVPEGVARPVDAPVAPAQTAIYPPLNSPVNMSTVQPEWFQPWGNMIKYIHDQMKAMDGDTMVDPAPAPEPAKGVEQLAGPPLDEETKANLDGIFTPELIPEDVEPEPEV